MKENYYQILEVNVDATLEDIKTSYKKLVKILHPDKPSGNEEKFKKLNDAYETLSNDDKRFQYDSENGFKKSYSSSRNKYTYSYPDFSYSDNTWADFIKNVKKEAKQQQKNINKEFVITASLQEVYSGFSKTFNMKNSSNFEKKFTAHFSPRSKQSINMLSLENGSVITVLTKISIPIIREYNKVIIVDNYDVHINLNWDSFSKSVDLNLDFLKQFISFSKPINYKKGPFLVLPEQGLLDSEGNYGTLFINFE